MGEIDMEEACFAWGCGEYGVVLFWMKVRFLLVRSSGPFRPVEPHPLPRPYSGT